MSVNQIQLRGFRTRALGTLFHKMNNDLMTIDNKWIWAVATRFVLAQGTLQATKVNFVFISQNKKKKLIGIGPTLPFLGYMSSSAIWLLQSFRRQLTDHHYPLGYWLATWNLQNLPLINSTTSLPKSYKLSLLTANIAGLVCTTLNLKPIKETNTEQ